MGGFSPEDQPIPEPFLRPSYVVLDAESERKVPAWYWEPPKP